MRPVKFYHVEIPGYYYGSHHAQSIGKLRMQMAHKLVEVGFCASIGDALRVIKVRAARDSYTDPPCAASP
jgi:hypothetical protein